MSVTVTPAMIKELRERTAAGLMDCKKALVETDGDQIKDKLAELPRVIDHDYSGLDRDRIYAIGWSAGAGAVGRGLCHISKKSDFSALGTTSDIYAAVVAMGGCGAATGGGSLPGQCAWGRPSLKRSLSYSTRGRKMAGSVSGHRWQGGSCTPARAESG